MKQDLLRKTAESRGADVQQAIQAAMHSLTGEERWDYIVLFSSEGLPLAQDGIPGAFDPDRLLEFAFYLISAVRSLTDSPPVTEISVRGEGNEILLFHFFEAWGESMVLAAVTRGKRGYRRAVGNLVRVIQSLA